MERDDKIFWVKKDTIAGRCGPVMAPWNPSMFGDMGIDGIVSFHRLEPEEEEAIQDAGLTHSRLYFPSMALDQENLRTKFLSLMEEFFHFVETVHQENGAVLVHCHAGLDRTPTAIACYLIHTEGYTAEEAIERLVEVRPKAFATAGYKQAVKEFEERETELIS